LLFESLLGEVCGPVENDAGRPGALNCARLGIAIFFTLTLLEWALLHRWHERALKKQV
jgi:hypothetical protein